jgi:ribulose-5-phosphate 4-epimerase/fuculose-1-phosphate aldolase
MSDSEGSLEETIERVAEACRVLGKLGATHGSYGHVSQRWGEDSMLIKGKGAQEASLARTRAGDIVHVNFDIQNVDSRQDLRAPSESFLHAWIYRTRPDVQSVIHMHPESAVLLTVCGIEPEPLYGAYGAGSKVVAEDLRTYDFSLTVNSHERGEAFAQFFGDSRATLMRGHGVTTAGESIEDAAVTMMLTKEACDFTYKAHAIGKPVPLPDDELAEWSQPVPAGRKFGSAGGKAGVLSTWRNFRIDAGELEA